MLDEVRRDVVGALEPGRVLEHDVRVLLRLLDHGVAVAEARREDHLVALRDQLLDRGARVRLGNAVEEGGLDVSGELALDELAGFVVLERPARVARWADVHEADLEGFSGCVAFIVVTSTSGSDEGKSKCDANRREQAKHQGLLNDGLGGLSLPKREHPCNRSGDEPSAGDEVFAHFGFVAARVVEAKRDERWLHPPVVSLASARSCSCPDRARRCAELRLPV